MSRNSLLAAKLFKNRDKTGDVTFIVESEKIRAHRCVLAAFSPKYIAQLYDTELERDNIIVNGVTAAAFNEFLQFFYCNKVNLTADNIDSVLDLAKQSLVDDFVQECVDFLKQTVAIENLCSSYRLANLYDITELKDLCEQKISTKSTELFVTEDFAHCDPETLMHILNLESLCCKEMEVFDACIVWDRVACSQKHIDATNPTNLRTELGDAIYKVRFGSLTLEEFVTRHQSIEGFFTPHEINEIMYMIGKLKDFKSENFNQTPRGISSSVPSIQEVPCDFECNRIMSVRKNITNYTYSNPAGFTTNKPIRLLGFALNTTWRIQDTNDFSISFLNGTTRVEFVPKYTLKYTTEPKDEVKVVFENSISILNGNVMIRMPKLDCDVDLKYELASQVEFDVFKFTFFGEFPMITRLFVNRP